MSQYIYGKNAVVEILGNSTDTLIEVYLQGSSGKALDKNLHDDLLKAGIKTQIRDKVFLEQKAASAKHQGVVALVKDFVYSDLDELLQKLKDKALFLMCDSIQDPQNLGAIIRSAVCFGVDAVIINKDQSVGVTPTVMKASAGALSHVPVVQATNLARTLEKLKEQGFWAYATSPHAKQSLSEISPSPKMVVVIGNEGKGIRRLVDESCDFHVKIPMSEKFESLNAAQATTVMLYEIFKRRSL